MNIELRVGHIIKAAKVFNNPKFHDAELPMAVSLWLVRNAKATGEVAQVFSERNKKLFESMAQMMPPEGGGPAEKRIPMEYMSEYQAGVNKMLDELVEIEYSVIPATALRELVLTPKEVVAVIYAISED